MWPFSRKLSLMMKQKTAKDELKVYEALSQLLFIGFKDASISTITLNTHALLNEESTSALLKNQLALLISYSDPLKKRRKSTTLMNCNKESPLDIIHQIINNEQEDEDNDENSVPIFLMLYRKFMAPNQLLNQLIYQFEHQDMSQPEAVHTRRQKRTLGIISTWLHCYWCDFYDISTRQLLAAFLERTNCCMFISLYETIESLASRDPPDEDQDALWGIKAKKYNGYESLLSIEKQPILLRRSHSSHIPVKDVGDEDDSERSKRYSAPPFGDIRGQRPIVRVLMSIPVKVMAEQLTLLETKLFLKIQPRDFLKHTWISQKTKETPISASIHHFNYISGWIASMIVDQVKMEDRAFVYEYCLKVAVELEKLNNFNSLMAVMAGVNSAAILRLKETKQLVASKNKTLVDQFAQLENLMSSERSFYNYRCAIKERTKVAGIPYLGVHQQDLLSLSEANKDHREDGKIHWQKFHLIGESILEVIQFQERPMHPIKSNPFVLCFIRNESKVLTEDVRLKWVVDYLQTNCPLL
ncbi:hypothetical protein G6F37_003093 [Rhizopus arrhizus]|nr:hypothetical protein G6F38_005123 [Rhizopus arrhizus]KAG1161414.1 hypothetical protein G6F37_003093 [Rhizopus arrhizus]